MSRRLALVLAALTACADSRLSSVQSALEVEPLALDFGAAFVGHPATARLSLRNVGRGALRVELATSAPFSLPGDEALEPRVPRVELQVPGGEARTLDVTLWPEAAGEVRGTLSVRWSGVTREVALSGLAAAPPACAPSGPCVEARFEPSSGACVEVPLPDDTACDSDRCLTGGRCARGVCVGTPISCDDRDACTADRCEPGVGCRHDDTTAACPASLDPCRVPACDRTAGCLLVDAADGTPCGPNDCRTAQVCMQGRCEVRVAPQGSTCAPATPCEGPGLCAGTACERPPPSALAPVWRYLPQAGRSLDFDGTVDPDGNVFFVERDGPYPNQTFELVSLSRDGVERFRVPVGGGCSYCAASVMLDPPARRLFVAQGHVVEARIAVDGRLLWQRDVSVGIPVNHPRPDGGAEIGAYSPIGLANGQLGVMVGEGNELHDQYVVTLDRNTGAPGWRVHRAGHTGGQGASASGFVYLTSSACWAPGGEMVRIEPNGGIGRAQTSIGQPVAFEGERVLWHVTTGVSVLDSSFNEAQVLLPPSHSYAWSTPLMTPARLVVPTTLAAYEAGAWRRQPFVSDYDGVTLRRRWTRPLPSASEHPSLMLAASGHVLAQTNEGDGGGLLIDVATNAGLEFVCPLDGRPQSPPVVVRGRATVALWRDGPAGGAYELAAYELPGLDVAAGGWAGENGGPSRDRRAR